MLTCSRCKFFYDEDKLSACPNCQLVPEAAPVVTIPIPRTPTPEVGTFEAIMLLLAKIATVLNDPDATDHQEVVMSTVLDYHARRDPTIRGFHDRKCRADFKEAVERLLKRTPREKVE